MTRRILFLCRHGCCRSLMALGFARQKVPDGVDVVVGALEDAPVDPLVVDVMREAGVDVDPSDCHRRDDLFAQEFDLVVALSEDPGAELPLLPGHPAVIQWQLPAPAEASLETPARRAALVQLRDRIRQLVRDFFDQGYFQAFMAMRGTENLILDGVSDGIMAHDLDQRIVSLNLPAERITGVKREDALGRRCSEVFGGNFCGPHCALGNLDHFDERRQRVNLTTPAGERRVLDVRLRPLLDRRTDKRVGVVVAFHDLTREQELERRIGEEQSFDGIVGHDVKMQAVYELIRDVADSNVPVMIQGESGTGKELVASAIHNGSLRADRQFVAVNCGALPEGLLESELFGHVRGSFTGAFRDKKGRFEIADGGTVFLDEIGDITPAMQVRLMRVLQDGVIQRVGSETSVRVDVRVISATNKDLRKEIESGRFRDDLYYRLNVVPILLPPLRERVTDIPLLADHLLRRFVKQQGRQENLRISAEAMDIMLSYAWPGNVRELQNWLQFALIKCHGETILPEHLPTHLIGLRAFDTSPGGAPAFVPRAGARNVLTLERVREALARTGGNRVEAARALGVSRATLYRFFASHADVLPKEEPA